MKAWGRWAAWLLCSLTASLAAAAGISANVDRREGTLQDTFLLLLTVEGSQSAEPHLPPLPAFAVHDYGRASKVTMVNGRFSSSVTYTYALTPKQLGRQSIGPASVTLDGKDYLSAPLTVSVVDAAAAPEEGHSDDALLITAAVSNKAPFVGEQLLYTWRFLRRERIANAQMSQPSFDEFDSEALGGQQEYEAIHRGQRYTVTEIRQALYPLEEGDLKLPASTVQCEVLTGRRDGLGSPLDGFFGRGSREARTVRGPALSLQVRPLPEPPANFSGLVGKVTLQASVSSTHLRVGDSATLVLKLSGTANLKNVAAPNFSLPKGLKAYDDRAGVESRAGESGLLQSKTFRKALVPSVGGILQVGPFTLTTFDPNSQQYQALSSPAVVLHVTPGEKQGGDKVAAPADAEAGPAQKVAVEVLADDILPNAHRREAAMAAPALSPVAMALATALPVALYGLAALLTRRQARRSAVGRRRQRRRRQARAQAQAELAALPSAEQAEAISRILRSYLGDVLQLEGLALTPAEVRALLAERPIPTEVRTAWTTLLARCDALHYDATAPQRRDGSKSLRDQALELLAQLDTYL